MVTSRTEVQKEVLHIHGTTAQNGKLHRANTACNKAIA